MTRAIPELPGCNPRFDGPGYPASKPVCDRVMPKVEIGKPKRLFAWDDKDPRHVGWPRKLAVWDVVGNSASSSSSVPGSSSISATTRSTSTATTTKSSISTTFTTVKTTTASKSTTTKTTKSTTTTTSVVPVQTGPASGTMYLTQGQNWDGYAENWSWTRGTCKVLSSALYVPLPPSPSRVLLLSIFCGNC